MPTPGLLNPIQLQPLPLISWGWIPKLPTVSLLLPLQVLELGPMALLQRLQVNQLNFLTQLKLVYSFASPYTRLYTSLTPLPVS